MRAPRLLVVFVVAALAVVAACGDNSLGLPAARYNNVVDSVSVWALDGTPLNTPSAYSISGRVALRTDHTTAFDFAFNITPSGQAVLLPTAALGLEEAAGLLLPPKRLASITVAPS